MTIQPRAKVHPGANNQGQVLAVTKIVQAQSTQGFGMKLRQYIDIAACWIKVLPQNRAKEAQTADSTVLVKDRYLPWINLYG